MERQLRYPFVLKIKASAGSGKTYNLTLHYLKHLGQVRTISPETLKSLIAVTFTNKAAAEMRDRILQCLKEIALETPKGKVLANQAGLSAEKASRWTNLILANYDDFRIQTIDSLVFQIMKVLALEIGTRADVEPDFNTERIVNQALNIMLLNFRKNEEINSLLHESLKTFLTIEEKEGINPEKHLRKRMVELFETFRGKLKDIAVSIRLGKESPSVHLSHQAQNIKEYARILMDICKEENLNSHARKMLESPLDNLTSAYWNKNNIKDLLLKKAHQKVEKTRAQEVFEQLKKCYQSYIYTLSAAKVDSYKHLLYKLSAMVDDLCHRRNLILGGDWLNTVRSYLTENPLPLVYAYLGNRFRHFLIDEFQDTNPGQWQVLQPLVENALSEGGSLVYVGDPKQSIYMWRDAEPDLFDQIGHYLPSAEVCESSLTANWRSFSNIVSFNNTLFTHLKDKNFLKNLIHTHFTDSYALHNEADEFADKIAACFKEAEQTSNSSGTNTSQGFVKVCFIGESNPYTSVEDFLVQEISNLAKSRTLYEITILVRTNTQSSEVFSWLFKRGIPAITENSLRIEKSPAVKALINLMSYLNDPDNEVALLGFLESPIVVTFLKYHNLEFPETWILEARNSKKSLGSYLKEDLPILYEKIFSPFIHATFTNTAYDTARIALEYFDVITCFPDEKSFLYRFLELINYTEEKKRNFFSLSEFVDMWHRENIDEKLGIPENLPLQVVGDDKNRYTGAVRIMTIHGAKGLEFPVVFVPFTDWKYRTNRVILLDNGELVQPSRPIPFEILKKMREQRKRDFLESLNLFYVALTRAKEGLFVAVPSNPKEMGKVFKQLLNATVPTHLDITEKADRAEEPDRPLS